MTADQKNTAKDLKAKSGSSDAQPSNAFISGLKSLPTATAGRLSKLKGLSPSRIKALDKFLVPACESSPDLASDTDGYIPLKNRLTAWWHGEDIVVSSKPVRKEDQRAIEVSEHHDPRRWTPDSISMAQNLWGKGFAEPGGPVFAKKLLSLMKFEPSNTILDLSAGLGGTACILSKEYKLWMDAFEANEELANSGFQFASRSGLAKKVPIKYVDFETLELPEKKYDQIYSLDSLFMTKNKKNVIRQIAKSLKNKGQILIVDYMLADKCNPVSVKNWTNSEPEKPHPWTVELYKTAMSHYGITVWSVNDLSEEYIEQIHEGWLAMVERIDKGDFDRNSIDKLMREGEIWLNRARAIEAGDLTIQRIHGVV